MASGVEDELRRRIGELEKELEAARTAGAGAASARDKIQQMSGEVVDTNPYRWLGLVFGVGILGFEGEVFGIDGVRLVL